MFIKINLFIVICISALGFQAQSCRPMEDDRINRMGPDVRAELVFFFKKGVSPDEIFEFQRTVIGIPNEKSTGYSSLPGMMTKVAIEINGYEGGAINFRPNATEEQKAFVKKRVVESPLIYRVYEKVVPNKIEDLPNDESQELDNTSPSTKPTRKPVRTKIP